MRELLFFFVSQYLSWWFHHSLIYMWTKSVSLYTNKRIRCVKNSLTLKIDFFTFYSILNLKKNLKLNCSLKILWKSDLWLNKTGILASCNHAVRLLTLNSHKTLGENQGGMLRAVLNKSSKKLNCYLASIS